MLYVVLTNFIINVTFFIRRRIIHVILTVIRTNFSREKKEVHDLCSYKRFYL